MGPLLEWPARDPPVARWPRPLGAAICPNAIGVAPSGILGFSVSPLQFFASVAPVGAPERRHQEGDAVGHGMAGPPTPMD